MAPFAKASAYQNADSPIEKLVTALLIHPDLPSDTTKPFLDNLKEKNLWSILYNSATIFCDNATIRKDREMLTLLHDAVTVAVSIQQEQFNSADAVCKRKAHSSGTNQRLHRLKHRDEAFESLVAFKRCLNCVESWLDDLDSGAEDTGTNHLRNTTSNKSKCDYPDLWKQQVEMMRLRGSCHVNEDWFQEETKAGIFGVLDALKELNVPSEDLKEVKAYAKKKKYVEALLTLLILFVKFNYHKDEHSLVRLLKLTWDKCFAYWRLKFEKLSPQQEHLSTRYYVRLCASGWRTVARWCELNCEVREFSTRRPDVPLTDKTTSCQITTES